MAVVDASYKFKMVDIGQRGSVSNGGVWENSEMGHGWSDGKYDDVCGFCGLGVDSVCHHYSDTTKG